MPFWLGLCIVLATYILGFITGAGAMEKDQSIICGECIAKGDD